MIILDDRLRTSADDIQKAAARVPVRAVATRRSPVTRALGWAVAAAVVAALIATPLWLGAFGGGGNGLPVAGDTPPIDDIEPYLWNGADAIAWLADGVTVGQAADLVEEIRVWEGVAGAAYVSREIALFEFREHFADQRLLLRAVEDDPSILPRSIRLILTADADLPGIARRLAALPDVVIVLRHLDESARWMEFRLGDANRQRTRLERLVVIERLIELGLIERPDETTDTSGNG